MKRSLILVSLFLLLCSSVQAQTVTITEVTAGSMKLIAVAWISDATGDAVGTTSGVFTGKIQWLVTDPGATAPTDNYDITITDSNSVDVLAAAGANRDTANTEYVASASLGAVVLSKLTVTIANAGNAKVGAIYLYVK